MNNKIDSRYLRVKTEQTLPSDMSIGFTASRNKLSSLLELSLRPSFIIKKDKIESNLKQKMEKNKIKLENMRIVSKLIEINNRRAKINFSNSTSPVKKREQLSKERQIFHQNQRLGRSLVRIKSGKTIERVKQQIERRLKKKMNFQKNKSDKEQRLDTEESNTGTKSLFLQTKQSNPEIQHYPAPAQSAKTLKRSKNIAISEFVQLRKYYPQ